MSDEATSSAGKTLVERLAVVEHIAMDLRQEWRATIRPKLHDFSTTSTEHATRLDELEREWSKLSSQPPKGDRHSVPVLNGVLLLVVGAVIARDPEAVLRFIGQLLKP